jgi:chitodextrinase
MKRTPLIIVSTCILLLLLLLPLASSAQSIPNRQPNTSAQAPSAASGCGPAWNPNTVYSSPGNLVTRNGVNYKNNWWTLGDDPATHSGPAGSGQPWTSVGACSSCSTLPSVPTGLSASGTTGSSTNLSWHASTAASNCTVTGYTVFRNGNSVGTSGGTSFTVTGLAAQTTYSFAVAALDPAGSSGRSAAVNVTTGKGGGGGGGGSKVFAPYDDISLAVGEQVVSMAQQAGLKAITLAFMVDGGCTAVWGGLGGTTFPNGTPVATAISQLQSNGVTVYIAFGGANGSVLSSCGNAGSAQAMYQAVVNTYHPAGLDFDIEGGVNASVLMQALAGLKRANGNLTISLTLPVLSSGLVTAGTDLLAAAHQAGFNPDVVNVMAMDMGSANDNGGNMGLSATQAASNTHNQVMAAGLSSSIGVTPMIGVNDTNTEIFRFSDVNTLLNFTASNSYITRLAFWSLARDNGSCPNQGFASPVCSGVSQNTFQFSQSFEAFH